MAQTTVCNRHHSIDRQLCRWLLLSINRLSSNELKVTQELIANMLGVRQPRTEIKASPQPTQLELAVANPRMVGSIGRWWSHRL
jgi:hypothetical protein